MDVSDARWVIHGKVITRRIDKLVVDEEAGWLLVLEPVGQGDFDG